jgi:hypothetical protein
MSGFKFDRDFGIAYECRGLRFGPTAPGPLVVFVPLVIIARLWWLAIRLLRGEV